MLPSKSTLSAGVIATMVLTMSAGTHAAGFGTGGFFSALFLPQAQVTQNSDVVVDSNTDVVAALNTASDNDTVATQLSTTGPHNQTLGGSTTADAVADVMAALNAGNGTSVDQNADMASQANQDAGILAGAFNNVDLGVDVSGTSDSDLTQLALGAGPSNQGMTNDGGASALATTGMAANTANLLGLTQNAGAAAQGNQDAGVGAIAASNIAQDVSANAASINTLGQLAAGVGSHNQFITNVNNTFIGTLAQQFINTSNILNLTQICGSDCNQTANVDLTAITNAGQVVDGTALAVNVINQNALGSNSGNQSALSDSSASALLLGLQDVGSLNVVGVAQVGGNGPANQDGSVSADALADAFQLVGGGALSANVITQNDQGSGSHNQDADGTSGAAAIGVATQGTLAENLIGLGQQSGNGQGNQMADIGANADAGSLQIALIGSNSLGQIAQNAQGGGSANQSADNGVGSLAFGVASQQNGALNGIQAAQVNGNGQGNQDMGVGADATSFAAQISDTEAGATGILTQDVSGNGSANQDGTNGVGAAAVSLADQTAGAVNGAQLAQVNGGGQGNQDMDADMNAGTAAFQLDTNGATALGFLAQGKSGDGSSNQTADQAVAALGTTQASQDAGSLNSINALQVQGAGQGNQDATIGADAGTLALQGVSNSAAAVGLVDQTANGTGSANQDASNGVSADGSAIAGQNAQSANVASLNQLDANGQGNQMADLDLGAGVLGVQGVTNTSAALGTISQNVGGSGSRNQNADQDVSADSVAAGQQNLGAGNLVGVNQIHGLGQGNQDLSLDADADVGGFQGVNGSAVAAGSIVQDPSGSTNQTADQDVNAGNTSVGVQTGNALNNAGVVQFNPNGQGNQSATLGLGAASFLGQSVNGDAIAEGDIHQHANAVNGQANQDASNAGDATNVTGASQTGNAVNNVGLTQAAGANPGGVSQLADIAADADIIGSQDVNGTAINAQGIGQVATGNGQNNQTASNDGTAGNITTGAQNLNAQNNIGVSQTESVAHGAGTQAVYVAPVAVVDASQSVSGGAANLQGINQDATGTQGNQDASNNGGALNVTGASQNAAAVNNIGVSQSQSLSSAAGAQYLEITPVAVVNADQDVTGQAVNAQGINQDPSGQGNQSGSNNGGALNVTGAGQNATAGNNVTVQQTGTANHGAIAQAGEVAPTAITDADQDVGTSAQNAQGVNQQNSGPQGNQNGSNNGGATNLTGASQDAHSQNNGQIVQGCDVNHGACAQYFIYAPTASTTADQDVNSGASNTQGVSQNNGGNAGSTNQGASNTGDATTLTDADQDASATNNGTLFQICTANGGACAQFTDYTAGADTNASQTVNAGSENNQGVTQSANGGSANQNAANDGSATTGVSAGQQADTTNNTVLGQVSTGSNPANQGATVNVQGATDADQTINAGSQNNSGIDQSAAGGAANQNAGSTGTAATDVAAQQNANTANNTGVSQVSGGGGNQTANVNSGASTNAGMVINAGSTNNTNIVQH